MITLMLKFLIMHGVKKTGTIKLIRNTEDYILNGLVGRVQAGRLKILTELQSAACDAAGVI